jgi:extracellular elastinolytic metalloproteinase
MPAGLAVIRRLAQTGRLRQVVVVGLGTNYLVTTNQLNELLRLLGPHRKLVLINTYVPGQWSKQVNATEAAFARKHPGVVLADWYDTIRNRLGLLWPDHIHPMIGGTKVYAHLVYQAVQATGAAPKLDRNGSLLDDKEAPACRSHCLRPGGMRSLSGGVSMDKRLLALPAAAGLVVSAITGTAGAATTHQAGRAADRPVPSASAPSTYDSRASAQPLHRTSAQAAAVRSMLRPLGRGARITYDPLFATPRELLRYGGYLTGPTSGSAVSVARSWISAHRAAFGLTAASVRGLVVSRDYVNPTSRTHVITFTQVFGGLQAVFGGRLNVAVTRDGRILNFTGSPRPSASLAARPRLSMAGAVGTVARRQAPRTPYQAAVTGRTGKWTRFARGPFGAPQYARPAAFPTTAGVRPAYEVIFTKSTSDMVDSVVDAVTGKILYRQSLTAGYTDIGTNSTDPGTSASGASQAAVSRHKTPAAAPAKSPGPAGLAFPYYPGAPAAPDQVLESFTGDATASPAGWLNPPVNGEFTTQGNNVDDHENWLATRPEPNPFRPTSSTGQFLFPFLNNWGNTNCADASYEQDVSQATTNLFYQHNRIHDEYYGYGFTESAGNFQNNDFGRGGIGGDAVQGDVQAGIQANPPNLDNANFSTPPDGLPGITNMFLWETIPGAFIAPCVDGDNDVSVIQHEYTHGMTNRMVGGGEALSGEQAGAMGEGWSDWYALNHLFNAGLETQPVEGIYVTANSVRGIRNYSYADSPLNYGDLGYDIVGNEVHADGEIWTATLWQLRQALVSKYGTKPGAHRAALLFTAALPDTPPAPSMLDARDGILTADQDLFGGRDIGMIWSAFANRGMGSQAGSQGSTDPDPLPSFSSPTTHDNGRLTLAVVTPAGKPLTGVNVFAGDYEARVTPAAVTAGRNATASLNMVPGSYDITLQAPGWGSRTITGIAITAGATTTRTVTIQPNLASATNGATIAASSGDDGTNLPANLIDDTEATAWGNTKTATAQDQSGSVTVALSPALDTASTLISTIRLGAFTGIGLPRFGAIKDYTIEVSDDGTNWTTVANGTVSAPPPRPVAPELNYQTITLASPVHANFVRLDVTHSQGPVTELSAAELQVFAGTP